jgi:hypothetical protein
MADTILDLPAPVGGKTPGAAGERPLGAEAPPASSALGARPALGAEPPLAGERRSLRAARGALPAGDLGAGAAALAQWAGARKSDLKVVAQRRDADGPMVDRALELVRKFIVERGLILFGGLAIDYALRLKGASIYPDAERPDFDFLSPRSVDDAYDLADLLQAAGFAEVGAIRGIHVQTMRVRTSFVFVADIGYAPRDVFDRIPTLDFRGMRIVHPDFQRMDMHLAFCFPFNGPPREDVFHRWKKDLARFNLFEAHYPLTAAATAGKAKPAPSAKKVRGQLAVPIVGHARDLTVALHGFAAYAVLRASLDELVTALSGDAPALESIPRLDLAFPDEKTLEVETPTGDAAYVASPWPDAAVAGLPDVQWSDPYMDLYPESARAGSLAVLSTRGRLLAAAIVSVSVSVATGPAKQQAYVVTPQYLLLFFLFEAQRAEGAAREVNRAFYGHTLAILRAAESIYADRLAGEEDAAARAVIMEEFARSPFAPTTRTLGTTNHDAAYVIKMATNAGKLRDTPPPALGLDPNIASLLVGLPQNYYPTTAKQRPTFDYGASVLFRRSGLPRAPV